MRSGSNASSLTGRRDYTDPAVFAPSLGFFGCQLAWALQAGYASAYLSSLGVSDVVISFCWLTGPIVGLISEPLLGIWSDSFRSPYGKRRPFIIGIAAITSLMLLVFSNARTIGNIFGDKRQVKSGDGSKIDKPVGITVAILSLTILSITTPMAEGPLRALVSDICTGEEQLRSNSLFSLTSGVGMIIGFSMSALISNPSISWAAGSALVFGSMFLTCFLSEERDSSLDPPKLPSRRQSIAMAELSGGMNDHNCDDDGDDGGDTVVSDGIIKAEAGGLKGNTERDDSQQNGGNQMTSMVELTEEDGRKENEKKEEEEKRALMMEGDLLMDGLESEMERIDSGVLMDEENNKQSPLYLAWDEMIYAFTHMPDTVWRCWLIHYSAFIGFTSLWIFMVDWYGRELYGGNSTSDNGTSNRHRYNNGVKTANWTFVAMSAVCATMSLFVEPIAQKLGFRLVWVVCAGISGLALLVTPAIPHVYIAVILHSLVGLGQAVTYAFPWSIITRYCMIYDPGNAALWNATLNVAEAAAEMSVSILTGFLILAFDDSVTPALILGGIGLFLSATFVFVFIDEDMQRFFDSDAAWAYKSIHDMHEHMDDDNEQHNSEPKKNIEN